MSDSVILYYTQSGKSNGNKGNTQIIADAICEKLLCDIVRIEADEPRIENSWYVDKKRLSKLAKSRPVLTSYLPTSTDYKNIYICSPCWWGTFPPAVFSQLDILTFDNRNVACIITHEGAMPDGCYKDLKKYCKRSKQLTFMTVHKDDIIKSSTRVSRWAETCFD